ncbi:DUF2972 domain-containing protein, partial [Campylobacter molothri]|nr:DUF2972 domain-containing protein [Campylobacter sp. RM9930]
VFLFNSCSGSEAIQHFFYLCDLESKVWVWLNANEIFKMNYNNTLNNNYSALCMPSIVNKNYLDLGNYEKLFYLINKKTDIFFIIRDPISIIKTALNHIDNLYAWNNFQQNSLYKKITYCNYSFESLFPKILYAYSNSYKVNIKDIDKCLSNYEFYFTLNKRLNILKNISKNIVCINFEELKFKNIFNTLNKLSMKFKFNKPSEKYRFVFESKVNTFEGLLHLPVEINIFNLQVFITTPYLLTLEKSNISKFKNITKIFFENDFVLDNIIITCDIKYNIDFFLKNNKWIEFKDYIVAYIKALKKYINYTKTNLISEEDILNYLKKNKQLYFKFRTHINENITYIKDNHPEYIKTWKYYQEFEKMCEELDGGSEIKQIENNSN